MQNWFTLANSQVSNGRFEDALQTIDRAIAQEPNNSIAHCFRGIALDSLRRQEEALNSYRTALSLDPSNIIASNQLGILLNRLGKPEDAMKVLKCALSGNYSPIATQRAALWTTLAMVQLNCQLIEAAEASSREALKLNPKLVSAHNNLALALKGRNLYAESVVHQRIAVKLSPVMHRGIRPYYST